MTVGHLPFFWSVIGCCLKKLRISLQQAFYTACFCVVRRMERATKGDAAALDFDRIHRLLHDLHAYSVWNWKKNLMLAYIFLLLIYVGMNVGLLGANFQDQDFIEEHYYRVFHMLAFWSVFVFTVLEAFILLTAEVMLFNYQNALQSSIVLFNVLFSFATAILFTIYPDRYEVPAHWMEYSVQILISSVSLLFVWNYISANEKQNIFFRFRYVELVAAVLIILLSILQLIIYSGRMHLKIGAERAAHFCEFVNEIFNGLFALFYAIVTYQQFRKRLNEHYERLSV